MKCEKEILGVDVTRGSTSVSSRDTLNMEQPELIKTLGIQDYNKCCSKSRANQINKLLAKFFHHNALPFDLVESDELADFIKALSLAYYQQRVPGRFWMETTGVDIVYNDVKDEVEEHLQGCDALMANMDGWENEKKQQLKIVTETGIPCNTYCNKSFITVILI